MIRWDPVVLARVRHLHLRARVLTDGLLTGMHRSRRVGSAVEFADFQEYLPGMDLRGLDWRVLARSDRLVVRRYEGETDLPCTLVVDLSGDLGTGDRGRYPDLDASKAGYALTLAATLAYWLSLQGEPLSLEILAGEGAAYPSLRPITGRAQLQRVLLSLASARPGGVAHLSDALLRVGERTRRRAWVGVLSDGMEEPSTWLPALAAFARRGADLRFLHLYDRREWTLSYRRAARFHSPEGDEVDLDPVAARSAFREVLAEYVDEVRGGVVHWGGQYLSVPTDRPLDEVFHRVVTGRTVGELP